MSKPIPGRPYVVQPGDTTKSITQRAYGDEIHEGALVAGNQTDGTELKSGDTLIIPVINTGGKQSVPPNKPDEAFTVLLDGKEIKVITASVIRSINAGAYGFKAVYPWVPGADTGIDEALKPYKYPKIEAFIGSTLIFSGVLYDSAPSLTADGRVKNLTAASYTADAIDSTIKPPYEKNNVTVEARATELIAPIGIALVIEPRVDTGGTFTRITAEPGDTIFSHISNLAAQRAFLVSTNPAGDMVFKVGSTDKYLGTVKEGDGVVIGWTGGFDGRKRFNAYRAIGQSPGVNSKPQIATDPAVPRTRFLTFQMDDTTQGNIKNAADWKRSKQLAESLSIPLPVNGFRAPLGDVWEENAGLTVISETLGIPDGFTFLIESVTYNYGPDGKTTDISITLPQAYTGEVLIDPWA